MKIRTLETEVDAAFHERQVEFVYQTKGQRVYFEHGVKSAHRQMEIRWTDDSKHTSARHLFSAPFIYAMILPLVILDVPLFIYQLICFRAYRMPRVRRADHEVIDRHMLVYLNLFEKLNCIY